MMPNGHMLVPIGRKNIGCESGLHSWTTKFKMGLPYLTCSKCGYHVPKPVLEKTMSRRELIDRTHAAMELQKPKITPNASPEVHAKEMEKLVVDLFESKQRNFKIDKTTRKPVYVGERK
jgi:hypothetical protein